VSLTPSNQDDPILKHVDKQKLVQDALDLVNVDSPTGREGEVAEVYASKLRALGMKVVMQEVEPNRSNVLATLKGTKKGSASLMFNGHLDTSFAASEDPEILKAISPVYRFEPPWGYVKGDWLYGMGAFNMKSALAAYIACVRAIQESGESLNGDLVIAGVVGEIEKSQVGRFKGPSYRGYGYGTSYLVCHGGTADVAVLGEPTGMRLMCSHSGSCWFRISLSGPLIHTGHSGKSKNPIQEMNKIISAIESWIPQYEGKFEYHGEKAKVNIGSIEGGWPWRASRTPSFCNLYIDVRFPPRFHAIDIREELDSVLESLKKSQQIDAQLELYLIDEWSEVSGDAFIAKAIKHAHKAVLGEAVQSVYFSWSSDANILTRYGISAVNYGPSGGPGKETRGTMFIPNLHSCAKVYALVAKDVCSKARKEVLTP
jgi:acetylornithine deacetylase/succinyl-diaminopimelate desuccinylase-like protein